MENDYYTWTEYVAEVLKLLPIESQRQGVGSTSTDYLTSLIRQAVIDLQRIIPGYVINHETLYRPEDMVREGHAMRMVKPPQSSFRDLSIFRVNADNSTSRYPGAAYPWGDRFDLINGRVAANDKQARYCIDPAGYTFYTYPMPYGECWMVSLHWDGQKLDFQDDEQVPFPESSALAVSYFVKANTSMEVEDDMASSDRYLDRFERQKPKLYIEDKARRGS